MPSFSASGAFILTRGLSLSLTFGLELGLVLGSALILRLSLSLVLAFGAVKSVLPLSDLQCLVFLHQVILS